MRAGLSLPFARSWGPSMRYQFSAPLTLENGLRFVNPEPLTRGSYSRGPLNLARSLPNRYFGACLSQICRPAHASRSGRNEEERV